MRAIILAKQLGDMGAHQLSACPKKKMRWYGQVNTSGGRTFAQALLTKPRRAQTRQLCGLTVFAFCEINQHTQPRQHDGIRNAEPDQ